jgi:hypothetical protein
MRGPEFIRVTTVPESRTNALRLQLVAEEVAARASGDGRDFRDPRGMAFGSKGEARNARRVSAAAGERRTVSAPRHSWPTKPGGCRRRGADPRHRGGRPQPAHSPASGRGPTASGSRCRSRRETAAGRRPQRSNPGCGGRGGRTASAGSESDTKVWRLSASAESRSARSRSFESGKDGRMESSALIATSSLPVLFEIRDARLGHRLEESRERAARAPRPAGDRRVLARVARQNETIRSFSRSGYVPRMNGVGGAVAHGVIMMRASENRGYLSPQEIRQCLEIDEIRRRPCHALP